MQTLIGRCRTAVAVVLALSSGPTGASAQAHPSRPTGADAAADRVPAADTTGWRVLGMAQAFPSVTFGAPFARSSALRLTELYLTQPAFMMNVASPGARFVLRTTLNFEGVTQEDGELTFGGWGEGFIDKRHPHTLVHELVLSVNFPDPAGEGASVFAGRGFAPFGTDDPMSRPGLKYPTNHHLSQILERWFLGGALLRGGWSLEAAVFGGGEPDGPYDLGNIEGFGDSWSARLARRWGGGRGPAAAWEASASYGSVAEESGGEGSRVHLWNLALRHARTYGSADLYALAEFSLSDPVGREGHRSVLAEALLTAGRHRPYLRLEVATRPEYSREGAAGSDGFFRYEHDDEPIGSTRWTIANLGYGFDAVSAAVSVRPFADVVFHRVSRGTGAGVPPPDVLFGADAFWAVSLGARVFFGGGPMRMGSYGVLDPMTAHAPMQMEMQMQMPGDM